MVFMGGLTKYVPISKTSFLLGTLSLCGIPPLACFLSKDEILNDSWLYSPIFAILAWATAGLTAFYMFQIYLLTFEGHLNVHFQNYTGNQNISLYSISLWGIPFNQEGTGLDISKWLAPSINLLHQKLRDSAGWYEFLKNETFSVSIAYFGIFLASFLYKPNYSSFKSFDLINSFIKIGPKRSYRDKIINVLYDWSYNRAYIDAFYTISFTGSIRGLAQLTHFFDRQIIDGIANGVGIMSFFVGEGIKYVGGGRIYSYLFLYFS
ncbi:hypothetical protein CASFOL_033219 [Castilleja foliolosa]|uniref:NAD(P)H-quinone oxidoreductase subunit 5, chloroplastic n=1 Tax=Castilleja foliolosa TaxID=1961234 RepID=A0ABD3BLV6_9LAMI